MFILSFDVGIKNLAYCLIEDLDDQRIIHKWDIVNLSYHDQLDENINTLLQDYKQMKIAELKENMLKLDLPIDHKKNELIKILEDYFYKNNLLKKKLSIFDIGKILVEKLDKLNILENAEIILIENQPSLKNPTMKTVQILLYSYFIVRGCIDKCSIKDLKLISANNKLKNCEKIEQFKGRSKNYKERKKLAIEYCEYLIENDKNNLNYFQFNSKKDDLADCYLQAVYYLNLNK